MAMRTYSLDAGPHPLTPRLHLFGGAISPPDPLSPWGEGEPNGRGGTLSRGGGDGERRFCGWWGGDAHAGLFAVFVGVGEGVEASPLPTADAGSSRRRVWESLRRQSRRFGRR